MEAMFGTSSDSTLGCLEHQQGGGWVPCEWVSKAWSHGLHGVRLLGWLVMDVTPRISLKDIRYRRIVECLQQGVALPSFCGTFHEIPRVFPTIPAPVHLPRDSSQPGAEDLCWGNGCCTSDLKGIRFKVMRFTTSAILLGVYTYKKQNPP